MLAVVLEVLRRRQHALRQEADDENAAWLLTIENHVTALLHAAQAGPDLVAGPACACSKAEALAQGVESLLLLFPVHQPRQGADMAFEERIRAAQGGREKEQFFLNLRRQMGEL